MNNKKLLHLIFWLIITFLFLYDRRYIIEKAGLNNFIVCILVRLALLISLAYWNLYYLVPRYYEEKKYLHYFSILAVSLFVYVTLQNVYDIYLYGYVIGDIERKTFGYAFPYNLLITTWYLILTTALKLSIDWFSQRETVKNLENEIKFLLDKEQAPLSKDNNATNEVFLKSGQKKIKVNVNDITHVQGLKDYSIIFANNQKIIVKGSLKTVLENLPSEKFIRVHKSYFIATDKIKIIERSKVFVGSFEVPVGRSFKHILENIA
jgi:hypothetical protein